MNQHKTRLESIHINAAKIRNLFNATHLSISPTGMSATTKKRIKSRGIVVAKQTIDTAPTLFKSSNDERIDMSRTLQKEDIKRSGRATTNNEQLNADSLSKVNSIITTQIIKLQQFNDDTTKSSIALLDTNRKFYHDRKSNTDALLPAVNNLTGHYKLQEQRAKISLLKSAPYTLPIKRSLSSLSFRTNTVATKSVNNSNRVNSTYLSSITNRQKDKVSNVLSMIHVTKKTAINNRPSQEHVNPTTTQSSMTSNTETQQTIADQNAIKINQYDIRGVVEKVLAEIIDTITPNF